MPIAASKLTPCLAMFARFFSSSHSTESIYETYCEELAWSYFWTRLFLPNVFMICIYKLLLRLAMAEMSEKFREGGGEIYRAAE